MGGGNTSKDVLNGDMRGGGREYFTFNYLDVMAQCSAVVP